MSNEYDREYEFEIIQKSLTTAHLQMPDFEPEPVPYEPPATPEPLQSGDE